MNTSDFRTSQSEFDFAGAGGGGGGGVNGAGMLHALAFAVGGGLVYLSIKGKRFAHLPSPGDVIIEEQKPEPEKVFFVPSFPPSGWPSPTRHCFSSSSCVGQRADDPSLLV